MKCKRNGEPARACLHCVSSKIRCDGARWEIDPAYASSARPPPSSVAGSAADERMAVMANRIEDLAARIVLLEEQNAVLRRASTSGEVAHEPSV